MYSFYRKNDAMNHFFTKIYDNVSSFLSKKSLFKDYHELYNKGEYSKAYTALSKAISSHSKWSKKGDPYVTLAKLKLLSDNDLETVEKLLKKANELGCSDKVTYYGMLGTLLWRKGDHSKSIQSFEKSVELGPNKVNLKHLGKVFSSEGDKKAIEIWNRLIKLYPKDCIGLAYLSIENEKVGNKDDALNMFKKAEKYAKNEDDFYELGFTYESFNYFEKALHFYLKCEEKSYKTRKFLFRRMAYCFFHLDNFNKAVIYAEKALDIDFYDEESENLIFQIAEKINESNLIVLAEKYRNTCLSYVLYAYEAARNNNFTNVYEFLSKALLLNPSNIERYYIGRIFHDIKDYEKAIATYYECEKYGFPYLTLLYGNIALCYFALGDQNSAIQYSVKSLELDITNDIVKSQLLIYTKDKEAGSDLENFIDHNQETSLSHIIFAQKALRQNNISNVRELTEKAYRLNPSLIEKFYIAQIYYDLGEFNKAIEIFNDCEKLGFKDIIRLYLSFAYSYYRLEDLNNSISYASKVLSVVPNNQDAKEIISACKEREY
jgi:tetratricopeptide (TPR) repeat protein